MNIVPSGKSRFEAFLSPIFFIAAFAIFLGTPASMDGAVPSRALVRGNTAFALDLYGQLDSAGGNLFFSPYSISSALAMTYAGARGDTADQMAQALQFPLDQAKIPYAFETLDAALLSDTANSQTLSIANALCLTNTFVGISHQYESLLHNKFGARIFDGDVNTINNWVSQKTDGCIPSVLSPSDLQLSVCVLLNAVYFKGTWQNQFQPVDTADSAFNLSATSQVTVPLMQQTAPFQMLTMGHFRALSMPYEGNRLSMVIALPDKVDGLPALEKELTTHNPYVWLASLDKAPVQQVVLTIPKFKFNTIYDLVPPCQELGITDAFLGGTADFSGMGPRKGELYISKIRHAAYVDVNETGTTAAGVTAVVVSPVCVIGPIINPFPVFRADHPFVFFIRDNSTGSILFLGRIVNPGSL